MVNQKSITGMEYTITVMVTVNCTVCHLQGALFFLGQIAFNANSVSTSSSVSLQHCRPQNKLQCLCNFSSTQAINSVISDHYASI